MYQRPCLPTKIFVYFKGKSMEHSQVSSRETLRWIMNGVVTCVLVRHTGILTWIVVAIVIRPPVYADSLNGILVGWPVMLSDSDVIAFWSAGIKTIKFVNIKLAYGEHRWRCHHMGVTAITHPRAKFRLRMMLQWAAVITCQRSISVPPQRWTLTALPFSTR